MEEIILTKRYRYIDVFLIRLGLCVIIFVMVCGLSQLIINFLFDGGAKIVFYIFSFGFISVFNIFVWIYFSRETEIQLINKEKSATLRVKTRLDPMEYVSNEVDITRKHVQVISKQHYMGLFVICIKYPNNLSERTYSSGFSTINISYVKSNDVGKIKLDINKYLQNMVLLNVQNKV